MTDSFDFKKESLSQSLRLPFPSPGLFPWDTHTFSNLSCTRAPEETKSVAVGYKGLVRDLSRLRTVFLLSSHSTPNHRTLIKTYKTLEQEYRRHPDNLPYANGRANPYDLRAAGSSRDGPPVLPKILFIIYDMYVALINVM